MGAAQPTPLEKLSWRIQTEFETKKLIGDIPINDEEYEILIQYLGNKLQWLKKLKLKDINDRTLCVALVQIGIRHYDSSFWPHVAKEIGLDTLSQDEQDLLGKSFFRTMNVRDKYVLGSSDRVYAILMQGFVCDNYAPKFFDFLYAFYNIDLERDISRLNEDVINELIEVMMRTDNTGRTYQLVVQTANAVRLYPEGAKTRVNWFLRLIDRAFWNEQLPDEPKDRLTRRFLEWAAASADIRSAQQNHHRSGKGKKLYSTPYYKLHISSGQVRLILPPQHIRFVEHLNLAWIVRISETELRLPINPYTQGVTGYRTEEASVTLNGTDALLGCSIQLINGNETLRSFSINEKKYRFFDSNGDSIPSDHLQSGAVYSISKADCVPVSNALQMQKNSNALCYCSYYLEDGDLICFPNLPPVAVGTRIANGLMLRGCVSGVRYSEGEKTYPVYSAAPTLILTLSSHRIAGTALLLNDNKYPLMRDGKLLNGAATFPMQDGTDSVGVMLKTESLGCSENGAYTLSVDTPGRSCCTSYRFLLLKEFRFSFADAPYLFKTHGTLCLPKSYPLEHKKAEYLTEGLAYKIDLEPNSSLFQCSCLGFTLVFDIPVFRYRFEGEEWMTAAHIDVWHSAFQPKLEIQAPGSQITFSLDEYANAAEYNEEHEITVSRTATDQLFHCDLTRFLSWFGRQSARRIIYVQCAGMEKKEKFLGIVTKSVLLSGKLQVNDAGDEVTGSFHIIGMAEFYADLYCGETCLAEKLPLKDGQFTLNMKLRSGIYTATIYEAEEDEYGFGSTYYEIGSREMQIIDPSDLTGKSVQIMLIQPVANPDSYLILYYKYIIVDLKKQEFDSNTYVGKMIVETKGGTLKATFPVLLTIPNIHNLDVGYVEFDEDGEPAAFIYDSVEHCILKYADHRKGKAVIYRRYDPVLWTDEYLYRLSFIIPTEQEINCNVDETEYNNLNHH